MRDDAGLEVAEVVGRVMHELNVPDAARMRLFEPLELALEEVEPLDVADDRGLARFVRSLEIGGVERATQAVVRDQLVHPIETPEVVLVELARLGRAQRGE